MTAGLRRVQAALAGAGVALGLGWGGWLAELHLAGEATPLDRLEAPLLDMRHLLAGRRTPPPDVVIVAIDDEAVVEAGSHPLARPTIARLVREIHRHRPRAIGLDLLFVDRGQPVEDETLAYALKEAGAVVAAAGLFRREAAPAPAGGDPLRGLPAAQRLIWPVPAIARAAGIGLVNVATDHGGTPRHVPLMLRAGDRLLPSFVLRTASRAGDDNPVLEADRLTLAGRVSRTDLAFNLPLRFYGPRGTIPTLSAASVLRGTAPAGLLRDRIVVVGSTAVGTGDTFATPYEAVMPGVEVLATAIAHVVSGDGLVRDRAVRRLDAGLAVGGAVAAALALALAPIAAALVGVALLVLAGMAAAVAAFAQGVWLSMTLPLAAILPVAGACALARIGVERVRMSRLSRTAGALRRFQAPELVDRIVSDPGFLAEPVSQAAGVVFVDLSGYTRLSEELGPADSRAVLAELHRLIDDEARGHGGVVLSFMGDGAMILFGIPDRGPRDGANALAAACALPERIGAWLAGQEDGRVRALGVRVGGHFGPVVVSRLGGGHHHITATGDSVNVASRLLEIAKELGAVLVVSDDLRAAAGPSAEPLDGTRTVVIRGRRQPLVVSYRLSHAATAA